jgi:hypothetical protein
MTTTRERWPYRVVYRPGPHQTYSEPVHLADNDTIACGKLSWCTHGERWVVVDSSGTLPPTCPRCKRVSKREG